MRCGGFLPRDAANAPGLSPLTRLQERGDHLRLLLRWHRRAYQRRAPALPETHRLDMRKFAIYFEEAMRHPDFDLP